jgi:hypothetical protein
MPVGDQDKPWAPNFTCEHCKKTLEGKMDNCSSLGWRIVCYQIFKKFLKVYNCLTFTFFFIFNVIERISYMKYVARISYTLVMDGINLSFHYHNFILLFYRMVHREKESHEVRYPKNLAGTY